MMPRAHRAYVIAICAVIGAAFAYAAADWGHWPALVYLPTSGELVLHAPAGSVSMIYWGLVAWGLGGAACGAVVGAIACAVWKRPLPDSALLVAGAWAIAALLLAGGYFTWSSWPWH
ncbi:MAG TPA: hypothetical protein VIV58_19960 [Kofleriaceae bacterium]